MSAFLFAAPSSFDGASGPLGPDGGKVHVGQKCKLPPNFAQVKMVQHPLP